MDPPKTGEPESDAPPANPESTQQKRAASSPLNDDLRNTRPRTNGNDDVTIPIANLNINATPNNENAAIHNKYFPSFKLLRKLNNKLITARHHKTFLTNLQERGQVPRGLQVKSAPTGAELDLQAYKEWEEAHIELANRLRDILIGHWIKTENSLSEQITDITEQLRTNSPPEQSNLILTLIDKANNAKALELETRRRRKARTATLGDAPTRPEENQETGAPPPPTM